MKSESPMYNAFESGTKNDVKPLNQNSPIQTLLFTQPKFVS